MSRPDRAAARAFTVEVAALLRQPGSRRRVRVEGDLADLEVSGSHVTGPVSLDAVLESVSEGILVTGTVRAPWAGTCRRCLEQASGVLESDVVELCCDDGDEETTYPLTGDLLDLAPIVHDACILELPLAPLCRADCAGLCPECGVNRNLEQCSCAAPLDLRWAALGALSSEATPDRATGADRSE